MLWYKCAAISEGSAASIIRGQIITGHMGSYEILALQLILPPPLLPLPPPQPLPNTVNCTVCLTFITALPSLPLGWDSCLISASSSKLKQRRKVYK